MTAYRVSNASFQQEHIHTLAKREMHGFVKMYDVRVVHLCIGKVGFRYFPAVFNKSLPHLVIKNVHGTQLILLPKHESPRRTPLTSIHSVVHPKFLNCMETSNVP
jgi:hypothetical protein